MKPQGRIDWQTIRPATATSQLEAPVPDRTLLDDGRVASFLADAARARQRVLLIVNDSHRATPTRPILDMVGAAARSIPTPPHMRAFVATGTHRIPQAERRDFERTTFGGGTLPIEDVAWHDADDSSAMSGLAGARIHGLVAEHRFLLPIGSIEPHYFAGTTGAHKTITIGCLSRDDIERNHAGAMSVHSDIMRLDGNPVFEGMVSIIHQLRDRGHRIFAVNTVADQGRILGAAAGDAIGTLRTLMPLVRATFTHRLAAAVDLAHLKVPAPLGRNFYQADKALKNCQSAVRRGGGIILEAACEDGIGPDAFMDLLDSATGYADACAIIQSRGYRLGDHKAAKLLHLTDRQHRNVRVALVTPNINDHRLPRVGVHVSRTVHEAMNWMHRSIDGSAAQAIVVEDAGVMCISAAPA